MTEELGESVISIDLVMPERVTRGQTVVLKAVVENSGTLAAKDVVFEWILPEFFEIVEGNQQEEFDILDTESSFTSEIVVSSDTDASLGEAEIKVRVSYV